jgi:anti-sigma factor RsiW
MRLRIRRRRTDLVCRQVVEIVTDYLEGRLSRADRRRFDAHLAGCPHCTEYLAQLRATIELTGRITADDLTPPMRAELVSVYRAWREQEP